MAILYNYESPSILTKCSINFLNMPFLCSKNTDGRCNFVTLSRNSTHWLLDWKSIIIHLREYRLKYRFIEYLLIATRSYQKCSTHTKIEEKKIFFCKFLIFFPDAFCRLSQSYWENRGWIYPKTRSTMFWMKRCNWMVPKRIRNFWLRQGTQRQSQRQSRPLSPSLSLRYDMHTIFLTASFA